MPRLPLPPLAPTVSAPYLRRRRGGPVAFLPHRGSFHTLYDRHGEILEWAQKTGARPAGPVYFVYLDDSAVTPEEDLRGEIALPLLEAVPSSAGVEVREVAPALCASCIYEGNASRAPSMWGLIYEWLEKGGWTEAAPPEKHQLLDDADLGEMDDAFELCVPIRRAG